MKFLPLWFVLICPVVLVAQTAQPTVRVEVTANSAPVADAQVLVGGRESRTGKDGAAILPAAPGSITISVKKDGYFPAQSTLQIDSVREWQVSIELQPQEKVEETVTVSATRNDVRLQDSPLHVEVLGLDEISEEIAMKPGDVVMMLNEMGGMHVQTTSPSLGASSVRVQGMRGRYTTFLSDGLPLFGQQGAGLGLLQIPPMDLSQVEVIKGNASALYGGSAMAGVVNLISRRPSKVPEREFLFNRGSLGATDTSVFLSSPLSTHWGASFLGGGNWQQHEDVNGDGWADVAGYARGLVRPRFFWNDNNGNSAFLTGGFLYEDRSGGTMPHAVLAATGAPYIEGLNTHRYDLGGNIQHILHKRFVVAARFSFSDQVHRHQFGENVENDRHELEFGEASIRGTLGRNIWVAGFADVREAFHPREVTRFKYTYTVPGLFAQDDITVAPWLTVSASGRVDIHNQYGAFFSPRFSALFRKSGWTSRVSAGQGFFAPTALTEETEAAGLTLLQMPSPFNAERGRSASFELSRNLGPLSVNGTFFASNIDHPVYVDRGAVYSIFNLNGPTRNRGAEVLATWRKSPFTATASYTYVHATELEPGAIRADVPVTPRHYLGLVGMWEKEGKARIGLEWYYTGTQRLEYNPFRADSQPYILFGAMGERTFKSHFKLFLNLENLGNIRQTQWDPLLLPVRASDGRWTVDAWAPLDGRTVNGGARFSF